EAPMHTLKECLRMEALCKKLALEEPNNKERWRAEARMWHQRAGENVTSIFGEVAVDPGDEQSNQSSQFAVPTAKLQAETTIPPAIIFFRSIDSNPSCEPEKKS